MDSGAPAEGPVEGDWGLDMRLAVLRGLEPPEGEGSPKGKGSPDGKDLVEGTRRLATTPPIVNSDCMRC